jgi:hypothetical protein
MPSLNDTLTLGLVLMLLFGAVSLYLYTRVQQCEQKLNLVESILLDIKMSAELRDYPDLPLRPMESAMFAGSAPAPIAYRQAANSRPSSPPRSPSPSDARQEAIDVAPFQDEAPGSVIVVAAEREMAERSVAPAVRPFPGEEPHPLSVPSAQPVQKVSSGVSVGANYESMTLSDLKALAAQRNITGAKSMKRAQILEVLRTSDRAAEATPLGGDLGEVQGFSAFDASTAEELQTIPDHAL